MNSGKVMIIDGNSILNRAFYGLQGTQLLSTRDGLYTNAVYGFINILLKYLDEEDPGYICVAFDLRAPTFRHREYENYKAKRKGMPDELAVQVPLVKEILDAMNIRRLEFEGYEADDIIGCVSLCAEKKGMETVIVTGDRDSLQLATEKTRIKLPSTKAGRTETEEYDRNKVIERYGITPDEFIDVKGLMGDQSDNIPGVPGIGEKTAIELIKAFGSIEKLYENLDRVEKKSVREKLESNRAIAFTSKRLAAIERNIPGICPVEELKRREYDREKLYEVFRRLEFKSMIEKFGLAPYSKAAPAGGAAVKAVCLDDPEELGGLVQTINNKREFSLFCLLDRMHGFGSRLAGVGISYEGGLPLYVTLGGKITEKYFLEKFRDVLENSDIKKYGHDMKDFIVYLKNSGISFAGLAFDTMIAAYVLDPSRENYTVSFLASEYLGLEVEPIERLSGKGKNFTPFCEMTPGSVSNTAAIHSDVVMKVSKVLAGKIHENDQDFLYYDVELPLVEVLADMEFRGFRVNPADLESLGKELEERINILTDEIYGAAGESFNINSTKQLGTILYEKLGLPASKRTKTGFSTDAETLEQLAESHEIVSRILEYRQMVKLKSTYVEGLLSVINPETGRIHSSFNQTVAATGRISSAEPNLQNIPVKLEMGRKIRRVFVPENEDFMLSDADYSQIELRVLAHITNDRNLISAFVNNEDIHTTTASQVFGVPKSEITPLMRSRAKAVNFGIIYGIGDFSLSRDLGITRKEARRYIDEYLNKYPDVKNYMHDIVLQGKEFGFVTTLFNRRRYIPELKSSNFTVRSFGERIAMNTPIQGSAADIIKIAMVRVYGALKERKMRSSLILQVHDELIVETHRDEKEQVAEILKENMENAVKLKVPLSVDVKTGNSWYETK